MLKFQKLISNSEQMLMSHFISSTAFSVLDSSWKLANEKSTAFWSDCSFLKMKFSCSKTGHESKIMTSVSVSVSSTEHLWTENSSDSGSSFAGDTLIKMELPIWTDWVDRSAAVANWSVSNGWRLKPRDNSTGASSLMSNTTVSAEALNDFEALATLLYLQVKPISWLLVSRNPPWTGFQS